MQILIFIMQIHENYMLNIGIRKMQILKWVGLAQCTSLSSNYSRAHPNIIVFYKCSKTNSNKSTYVAMSYVNEKKTIITLTTNIHHHQNFGKKLGILVGGD